MKKKFLIINSDFKVNKIFTGFLEVLSDTNFSFYLITSQKPLADFFKKRNWFVLRTILGPKIHKKIGVIIFLLLLPILYLLNFLVLVFLKIKYKFKIIICLSIKEKIIYTPLAKIFKLKIVWIENPENDYQKYHLFFKYLLKKFSKKVKIIVFLERTKIQLQRLGVKGEIEIVSPGVKKAVSKHQDNIFSNLAKKGEVWNNQNKYFTLGLVTDFEAPNQLDNLFRAVNICLTIISNLQIVVVGDGNYRKQVMWSNKKIGLENLTWFVGRQNNLKKWLDGFDVYIAVNDEPNDVNLKLNLKAMSVGLPIISFSGQGQEELIDHGQNGLVCEPGDSEMLSQLILKIYKNKAYKNKLGVTAEKTVENNFNVLKQAQKFADILEK